MQIRMSLPRKVGGGLFPQTRARVCLRARCHRGAAQVGECGSSTVGFQLCQREFCGGPFCQAGYFAQKLDFATAVLCLGAPASEDRRCRWPERIATPQVDDYQCRCPAVILRCPQRRWLPCVRQYSERSPVLSRVTRRRFLPRRFQDDVCGVFGSDAGSRKRSASPGRRCCAAECSFGSRGWSAAWVSRPGHVALLYWSESNSSRGEGAGPGVKLS